MPWKAKSHAERLRPHRRKVYDKAYEVKRHQDPALARAKALRNTARWQTVRKLYLNHQPLCEDPESRHPGQTRIATSIDHVIPLVKRPDLAYSFENLQALCRQCHAHKSVAERQGG